MKKRLLSGFLALIMVLLIGANGYYCNNIKIFADDDLSEEVKCGDTAYWTLDATNNELFINGSGAIDKYTFPKNVNSVVISEGITEIGSGAFRNSTLKKVDLPNSLITISDSAFWGCEYLVSLELPEGIRNVGNAAFEKCSSLDKITVDANNATFTVVDNVLYNKSITKLLLYPAAYNKKVFYIPDTVETIEFCAFDYNKYIKELHIPKTVVSLGEGVPFYKMESIENFVVDADNSVLCAVNGNLYNDEMTVLIKYAISKTDAYFEPFSSVTTIAEGAFEGASNLKSVLFGENINIIEYGALADCKALMNITISNPNCSIASSILAGTYENEGLTIYGYSDSTAMSYATNNDINFEVIEEKEITSIEIATLPKKMLYSLGEELNTVGMVIKVIYTDNTYTERSMGYEVSSLDSDDVGMKEITVSYEGKTTVFSVEVVETIDDIVVVSGDKLTIDVIEPNQTVYVYFTPIESGVYNFYAESNSDTIGYIFDLGGNLLKENDDGSLSENDFYISYDFIEGLTYALACKYLNENELGSFEIAIVKDGEEESTTEEIITENVTTDELMTEELKTEELTTKELTSEVATTVLVTKEVLTTEAVTLDNNTAISGQKTTKFEETTGSDTVKILKPTKVKIKRVKRVNRKKVKITWKKIKNISGYQIRYSTNKKFKKNVKMIKRIKASFRSKIIKGIKAKKTYYFQVRAYKKVNGTKTYGKWSKRKRI